MMKCNRCGEKGDVMHAAFCCGLTFCATCYTATHPVTCHAVLKGEDYPVLARVWENAEDEAAFADL